MSYQADIGTLGRADCFTDGRADVLAAATELTQALGTAESALGSPGMTMAVDAAVIALLGGLRTGYGAMGALDAGATRAGGTYAAAEDSAGRRYGGLDAR